MILQDELTVPGELCDSTLVQTNTDIPVKSVPQDPVVEDTLEAPL